MYFKNNQFIDFIYIFLKQCLFLIIYFKAAYNIVFHFEYFQVSVGQVMKVVHQVLINQTLVGIPFGIMAYYLMVWRGYNSGVTLPTFQWVLLELIFCVLIEEAGFYYSHRLVFLKKCYTLCVQFSFIVLPGKIIIFFLRCTYIFTI